MTVDRGGVVVQEVDELVAACVPDATAGAGENHRRIRREKGQRERVASGDRTLEPLKDLTRPFGPDTVSGPRYTHVAFHRAAAATFVHTIVDR